MADNPTFDVAGARKAGASDDQIISYLLGSRKSGFDVEGAKKAGANSQQIIDYLNGPSQVDQPGVLDRIGKAWDFNSLLPASDWPELGPQFRQQLMGAIGGILPDMQQGGQRTAAAMKRGDALDTLMQAPGMVPMFGQGAVQVGQDVKEGNLPEAAGHFLRLVTPLFGGKLAEGLVNTVPRLRSPITVGEPSLPPLKDFIKAKDLEGLHVGPTAGATYVAGRKLSQLKTRSPLTPPPVSRAAPPWTQFEPSEAPPPPEAVPGAQPPLPSGRVPGHLTDRPTISAYRTRDLPAWMPAYSIRDLPAWMQYEPPAPQPPLEGAPGVQPPLPSGRIPGHLKPQPEPTPAPSGRVPQWAGNESVPYEAPPQFQQPVIPPARTPGHLREGLPPQPALPVAPGETAPPIAEPKLGLSDEQVEAATRRASAIQKLHPDYQDMAREYGLQPATDAYNKDLKIAQRLKDQGVTPDQWQGMDLESKNAHAKAAGFRAFDKGGTRSRGTLMGSKFIYDRLSELQ